MQRLRYDFFARAMLAGNQHVGIRRPNARQQLQHRLHGSRLGDQFRPPFGAQQAVFRFQHFSLPHCPAKFDLGAQNGNQPRIFPGLLDKVTGAAAHGLDREIDIGPRRHDDNAQAAVMSTELGQQLQTFRAGSSVAGVIEVDEQRIEGFAGNPVPYFAGRLRSLYPVAFRLQQ